MPSYGNYSSNRLFFCELITKNLKNHVEMTLLFQQLDCHYPRNVWFSLKITKKQIQLEIGEHITENSYSINRLNDKNSYIVLS